MRDKYPLVKDEIGSFFALDPMSQVLSAVVCDHISRICEKKEEDDSLWKRCLTVIMFGKRLHWTLDVYKAGIGKGYTALRYKFVKKVVDFVLRKYAEKDVWEQQESGEPVKMEISNPPDSDVGSYRSTAEKDGKSGTKAINKPFLAPLNPKSTQCIPRPAWLKEELLTRKAMKTAKLDDELLKADFEKDKKEKGLEQGEGFPLCKIIYSVLTNFMRDARKKARTRFFDDLSFLFDDWTACKWISNEDVCPPIVEFVHHEEYSTRSSQMPRAMTGLGMNVLKINRGLKEKFLQERKEMLFESSYDVWVAKRVSRKGKATKNTTWTRKRMHRLRSLLTVAFNFLVACTHSELQDTFIAAHPSSLFMAYRIAFVFREMIEDQFDHIEEEKRTARKSEAKYVTGFNVIVVKQAQASSRDEDPIASGTVADQKETEDGSPEGDKPPYGESPISEVELSAVENRKSCDRVKISELEVGRQEVSNSELEKADGASEGMYREAVNGETAERHVDGENGEEEGDDPHYKGTSAKEDKGEDVNGVTLHREMLRIELEITDLNPGADAKQRILDSVLRLVPDVFQKLYREGPNTKERLQLAKESRNDAPNETKKAASAAVSDGGCMGKEGDKDFGSDDDESDSDSNADARDLLDIT